MVTFKIERKGGIFSKLYPTFYILSPEGEFIMNAKKHVFSKTQNFHMSAIKGDFSKKGKGFLNGFRMSIWSWELKPSLNSRCLCSPWNIGQECLMSMTPNGKGRGRLFFGNVVSKRLWRLFAGVTTFVRIVWFLIRGDEKKVGRQRIFSTKRVDLLTMGH